MTGSSPRVRGLLVAGREGGVSRRIIPARAGFTDEGRGVGCPRPDHPRACGVYTAARVAVFDRPGIIPARAGFTASAGRAAACPLDHPRACGVYCQQGS